MRMLRVIRLTPQMVIAMGCVVVAPTTRADDGQTSTQPIDAALRDYLSGNGLLNRKLYDLAAADYRKFLADHPQHEKAPVARYGLAVCLFRMNQFDEAAVALKPLRNRRGFPYAAEVATLLGQCHLALGDYDDAVRAFVHVVREFPDDALADDAAAGLVEAHYKLGQHDETIAAAEQFAQRSPDSPLRERVEFFRAVAEMALHRYSLAARRLEQLLEKNPKGSLVDRASLLLAQCYHHDNALEKAASFYQKVLHGDAKQYRPDALLGLGVLEQQRGQNKNAGAQLDRLLSEFPDHPLARQALMQRGRAWFDLEEFDQAFKCFENAAEHETSEPDAAAYWMAKCRLRQERFDEAAERLQQSQKKFPTSALQPEMAYDRGIALFRAERLDDAAGVLTQLREQFPDHSLAVEALQLLATIRHQQKKFDESIRLCLEFQRSGTNDESAPLIAYLLAENEYLAGRFDKAADAYRDFMEQYPDNDRVDQARYRLGLALYRLDRFEEAEKELSGFTGAGDTPEAFRTSLLAMGDMFFQRNEWKKAEQLLTNYLADLLAKRVTAEQVAGADEALLKLGLAQQNQEEFDPALESFNRLIDAFDESPHRPQAIFEKGQVLVALGRSKEAASAFEHVVGDSAATRFVPFAENHLGLLAMNAEDFDRAADHFERARLHSDDPGFRAEARMQRAQALMAAEAFDRAEKELTEFLDRHADHADTLRAKAQLAIALARQDKHEEALRWFSRLEQDGFDRLEPSLRSAVLYEKAWCLRETGDNEAAGNAYRSLTGIDSGRPLNVHALLELSGIEMQAERFESAAELLNKVHDVISAGRMQISADIREQARYRLAVCAFKTDRFKNAAENFERFLNDFPKSALVASASYFCGESHFRAGKHRQAVKHLQRVAAKFESDPVYGPSLLRLGECLATLQNWPGSEQTLTTYRQRFPDSDHGFQAQFGIGWARENLGRYDEAIQAYQPVAQTHQGPTAARAQFQIGECLYAQKKYNDAVRALLKVDVLYAYPEWSAAALYEAGRCFEALAKPAEARAQFERVAQTFGDSRWAPLAEQRLGGLAASPVPGR